MTNLRLYPPQWVLPEVAATLARQVALDASPEGDLGLRLAGLLPDPGGRGAARAMTIMTGGPSGAPAGDRPSPLRAQPAQDRSVAAPFVGTVEPDGESRRVPLRTEGVQELPLISI